MDIDLNQPFRDENGFMQTSVVMEGDAPDGTRERLSMTVWVPFSDSRSVSTAAARDAGIEFLERALAALRNA